MKFLFVFVGSGLGGLLRFGFSLWSARALQSRFPLATFASNVLACLILGAILALVQKNVADERARLFWAVGLCGGFSTFSTFSAESIELLENGRWAEAVLYIAASLAACLAAVWLSMKFC